MNSNVIRIAHIIGKWVGGGVESVVMNYYRYIDRKQIQFDFICDSDSTNIPYEEIELLGGRVFLIPPYQKPLSYHKTLKTLLKKEKYEIIHSHISTMSIFPLFAAKQANIPIRIAHAHSTTNKKEKKKNLMKQCLRPFSRLFATNYMCCSELAGRWLFGNNKYEQGEVYLLNNAINLNKFVYNEKIRTLKRKELNIDDNILVFGNIGRFVEQKNHSFLIDIFCEIHKQKRNSLLMLVGQGPLEEIIKKKVNDLKLNECVKFLGQRNDVNELYQVFDAFLLPSLYEGLPVVGVEAQTASLPCFFSNAMTKEVKVLESTFFLSLNDDSKKWAKEIVENCESFKRKKTSQEVARKGFSIQEEAKKLSNYYFNCLLRKNKWRG